MNDVEIPAPDDQAASEPETRPKKKPRLVRDAIKAFIASVCFVIGAPFIAAGGILVIIGGALAIGVCATAIGLFAVLLIAGAVLVVAACAIGVGVFMIGAVLGLMVFLTGLTIWPKVMVADIIRACKEKSK